MPYKAPVSELDFILTHVVGFDRVTATDKFRDATPDVVTAMLREAGKICESVLAPLNPAGDANPAVLENGVVRTSPGFAAGHTAIAEAGLIGISADPAYGGLGLPHTMTTAVNDMMGSACLSLQLNPLLTQGQIEALEHHASDDIKALYLPNLISGAWTGTMNLTEPQAGSDVGALNAKAVPNDDGTYAVSGQKIYISWGDSDFSENICHLVLARLPDGGAGTKGISLFLVPKYLPDAQGDPGVANTLKVVSLEHKMGLHGSPTCVMHYDGATGWLVGAPHGGMAAMFTMMNNARLGVGVQGVSIAEAAYQHALAYATDRKQGRGLMPDGIGTILDHADVRRMLMAMKAETFAARALALDLAVAIDLAIATDDATMQARAAFLTPICKSYGTDTGIEVADRGIQIHGGMGFIEETGAAQYLRDVRVTAIYEGTNGIQAMDLVGRKMMDDRAAAFALIDEVHTTAAQTGNTTLADTAKTLRTATERMLALPLADRFAGAVPYQHAFALTLGGMYHLCAAHAAGGVGPRAALAHSFVHRQMAAVPGLLTEAVQGASDLYAMRAEDFAV